MPPPVRATHPPFPVEPPVRPRALRPGARVALVAPAGPVHEDRLAEACDRCRTLGLEPVLYPGARARRAYLAGDDAVRLADLQSAFDDPAIDAVWALRGGYGTLRIAEALDLYRQLRDPIPFIGFSDNTTLHVRHAALGVISFHGPHPAGPWPRDTEEAFERVLFAGEPLALAGAPSGAEGPGPTTLVAGCAEGRLIGGNLAVLAAMCGTPLQPDARGRILFLEDVGEPAYRVDRLLWQMHAAGVTSGVRGIAFGRFTGAPEGDACPVLDVLREYATRLAVPAVADLPFGHVDHNVTVPVGALARLDADAGTLDGVEGAVVR